MKVRERKPRVTEEQRQRAARAGIAGKKSVRFDSLPRVLVEPYIARKEKRKRSIGTRILGWMSAAALVLIGLFSFAAIGRSNSAQPGTPTRPVSTSVQANAPTLGEIKPLPEFLESVISRALGKSATESAVRLAAASAALWFLSHFLKGATKEIETIAEEAGAAVADDVKRGIKRVAKAITDNAGPVSERDPTEGIFETDAPLGERIQAVEDGYEGLKSARAELAQLVSKLPQTVELDSSLVSIDVRVPIWIHQLLMLPMLMSPDGDTFTGQGGAARSIAEAVGREAWPFLTNAIRVNHNDSNLAVRLSRVFDVMTQSLADSLRRADRIVGGSSRLIDSGVAPDGSALAGSEDLSIAPTGEAAAEPKD